MRTRAPRGTCSKPATTPTPTGRGWLGGRTDKVRWMKNLDVDDVEALLAELDGEVVIHFRWASVGGVDADLCHPFPVTRWAKTDLFGEADTVLFHNGTWSAYDEALRRLRQEHGKRLPRGPMSDTRAAALCVHAHGTAHPLQAARPVGVDERGAADPALRRLVGVPGDEGEQPQLPAAARTGGRRRSTGGRCRRLSDAACASPNSGPAGAPENGAQNGATPRGTATSLVSTNHPNRTLKP